MSLVKHVQSLNSYYIMIQAACITSLWSTMFSVLPNIHTEKILTVTKHESNTFQNMDGDYHFNKYRHRKREPMIKYFNITVNDHSPFLFPELHAPWNCHRASPTTTPPLLLPPLPKPSCDPMSLSTATAAGRTTSTGASIHLQEHHVAKNPNEFNKISITIDSHIERYSR